MKHKSPSRKHRSSAGSRFLFSYYGKELASYVLKSGRSSYIRRVARLWHNLEERNRIAFKHKLGTEELRVLEVIFKFLNDEEYQPLSLTTVAEAADLKKPNVSRALTKLVTKGVLERKTLSGSRKCYRLARLSRRKDH